VAVYREYPDGLVTFVTDSGQRVTLTSHERARQDVTGVPATVVVSKWRTPHSVVDVDETTLTAGERRARRDVEADLAHPTGPYHRRHQDYDAWPGYGKEYQDAYDTYWRSEGLDHNDRPTGMPMSDETREGIKDFLRAARRDREEYETAIDEAARKIEKSRGKRKAPVVVTAADGYAKGRTLGKRMARQRAAGDSSYDDRWDLVEAGKLGHAYLEEFLRGLNEGLGRET
jgi:hypothetical protein